jgi:wyosine [tRNA(Phe)-imidazoG37] synthetase (radical SAM superfamily)
MHAYGPVPSRRLGRSIGVSPIPAKVCPYSCVYCQLGRTMTFQTERASFFPKEQILSDVGRVMDADGEPDFITFVGDGEPTLCADLGWLIQQCKARWPVDVAVITNGALLSREDVLADLAAADVVLPSLDAATSSVFRRINRPHRAIVFQEMVQGLHRFRREFRGEIWVETMLVSGLNDSDRALRDLRTTLQSLGPDRVYVNVPIRPPAESWAKIPEPERFMRALDLLGPARSLRGRDSGAFAVGAFGDAAEAIVETSTRHPLREQQAREIEAEFGETDVVEALERKGQLVAVDYDSQRYLLPSCFARGV